MNNPFSPKFHRDATVTVWDVYSQGWTRTGAPSAALLATLSPATRERVQRHVAR